MPFQSDIERNRFPLFKPTFEAMVRMTNTIMWATGQFANFLFGKVAACASKCIQKYDQFALHCLLMCKHIQALTPIPQWGEN